MKSQNPKRFDKLFIILKIKSNMYLIQGELIITNEDTALKTNSNTLKKSDTEYKFWIHRIDLDIIGQLDNDKKLGSKSKRSHSIHKIHENDRILIFTKRNNNLEFIAYTKVDKTYQDSNELYDYYISRKKLELKGMKYFIEPLQTQDIGRELDFVINKNAISGSFTSEYREIDKRDFLRIIKRCGKENLTNELPEYLEEVNMFKDEFIISTFNSMNNVFKSFKNNKPINYKKAISVSKKVLKEEYGIEQSSEVLLELLSQSEMSEFIEIPPNAGLTLKDNESELKDDEITNEALSSGEDTYSKSAESKGESKTFTLVRQEKNHYWIHRTLLSVFNKIRDEKVIAAKSPNATNINKIGRNDKIIFVSKPGNTLEFIASSSIEGIDITKDLLYNDYYQSEKKLRLGDIEYFEKPLTTLEIGKKLDFVKDKNNVAGSFKSEYKEISKKDYDTIMNEVALTKDYPMHLEKVNIPLKSIILHSIKVLYSIIKNYTSNNLIEIKRFVSLLKEMLKGYKINKTYDELLDFYSKNVHEIELKHVPSRDPDKFVPLYTASGTKRNFTFIKIE